MADINDRIRSRLDSFVEELSDLVRQATLEAVNEALRGELRGHGGGQRRAATSSSSSSASDASRRNGRRKGQKRSQDEITTSAERAYKFIEANPGTGIEQIGKELGESTADLTLPLRKLLVEKRVGKKGQKRGTRYFPKGR